MSFLNPQSGAEASDSLATLTAATVGLAALVYSVDVIESFVSVSTADLLGSAQLVGGLLIVIAFIPLLVFFKARGGRPAGKPGQDSFLSVLFRQAALTAFSLTLVFMIVLSVLENRVLSKISAETAIDLVITFALAIFAVSFFVINRFGQDRGDIGGAS